MKAAKDVIRFDASLGKLSDEFGYHYFPVLREVSDAFGFKGNERRVVCTLNGVVSYQCSPMSLRRIVNGCNIGATKWTNDDDYGMNLARWPANFTEYVKAHFAEKIVRKLPGGQEKINDVVANEKISLVRFGYLKSFYLYFF